MKKNLAFIELMTLIKKEKFKYIRGVIYTLFATFASIASSLTLKFLVDDILLANNAKYLWTIQIVFIVLVFIQTLFNILRDVNYEKAALKILVSLRTKLCSKIINSKFSEFEQRTHGEYISTINYDVDGISSYLTSGIANLISSIISIVITVGFMFTLNYKLTFITLPIFPLIIIVFTFLQNRVERAGTDLQKSRKGNTTLLNNVLKEMILIKSLNVEDRFTDEYNSQTVKMQENIMKLNLIYKIMSFASWSMIMVPYQAIMYGVAGTWYFKTGIPSIGLMLAFANYANSLIGPVLAIQDYQKNWTYTKVCLNNINKVLELESEKKKTEIFDEECIKKYCFKLSDVSFAYNKNDNILSGLNVEIPENSITLFYGKSGIGKSTVLKLLFRLYENSSGDIYINDTNIMEINLEQYRKFIAYVPQDIRLFNGSIIDNLMLVNKNIDENDIKDILNKVHLSETINNLTNGLLTNVGEDGSIISGGQKQRVAIAQALLKKAKIILLDEPTSSLDEKSKENLMNTLIELKKNHTIIMTSHDISTRKIADKIIDFNDLIG